MLSGIIAGLVTGGSTILGALPILKNRSQGWNPWASLNLDFAIGMMLAAAAFNLISPAYQSLPDQKGAVSIAILLGTISIYSLSHLVHKITPAKWSSHRRAWLFVTAMMLHNFPEGLASGASLSSHSLTSGQGWTVVGAIVFQNFPEGLATAAAFLSIGLSRRASFWGAALTGAMEILGGSLGGVFATVTSASLPFILAFAGGAMMSVTLEEVIEKMRQTQLRYVLQKNFLAGACAVVLMNWFIN